jgi:hypothetical protein
MGPLLDDDDEEDVALIANALVEDAEQQQY